MIPTGRTIRTGVLALLAGAFMVGTATSPLPAPDHRYNVDGTLVRPGGDVAGYAVMMMGRIPGDTVLRLLRAESTSETDLSVTGTSGYFFLSVSTPVKADSLAVVAFRPDRPSGMSSVLAIDSGQAVEVWESVKVYRESSGCGDCSTNSGLEDRLVAFRYAYGPVTVNLP